MSETVRSFVAVSISEGARRQVGELVNGLRNEPSLGVRWIRPELMHLTLAFLGEVSPEFLKSAKDLLAQAARRHDAFAAQLGGLGAFPSPRRARVVWIGTEQGRERICALQADVAEVLSSVGYQPERRPFSPHLTVGRLRIPGDVSSITAAHFASEQFRIADVVLFRSVLQPGGPNYHRLSTFPLR